MSERLRLAKTWLHYRGDQQAIKACINVREVIRQDTGQYRVLFDRPFATGNYAVVASSTKGVAIIQANTPNSVMIFNKTLGDQFTDSEIFLVAYGDLEGGGA